MVEEDDDGGMEGVSRFLIRAQAPFVGSVMSYMFVVEGFRFIGFSVGLHV